MNLSRQMAEIGIHLGAKPWDDSAKAKYAMDTINPLPSIGLADGALITNQNNDVPAWLTQYFDPRVIEIFTARMAAEEIANPVKKGSYGTLSSIFSTVEYTGSISAYGDYSNEGRANSNANFPQRDAYYFQTILEVGDMETAVQGMARIDAAGRKQASAAKILKIAHNSFWFYGVSGLRNYGILNDPSLDVAISPGTGASGDIWDKKSSKEICNDIRTLVSRLITQSGNKIRKDDRMLLVCTGESAINLTSATDFNVSAWDMITKAFKGIELITAPEYDTAGGQLVQLIAPEVDGQQTMELGYVELMRGHGVVRELSSYVQKNSGATFGAYLYQPFAVATMIGV